MKALTLTQPWASAIAVGHKLIETRSWSTAYRGPLAIHASAKMTNADRVFAHREWAAGRIEFPLPFGVIVATCTLVDIRRTEDLTDLSDLELSYGDFSPKRFGWILQDVKALDPPAPARGAQGLWEWRRD